MAQLQRGVEGWRRREQLWEVRCMRLGPRRCHNWDMQGLWLLALGRLPRRWTEVLKSPGKKLV